MPTYQELEAAGFGVNPTTGVFGQARNTPESTAGNRAAYDKNYYAQAAQSQLQQLEVYRRMMRPDGMVDFGPDEEGNPQIVPFTTIERGIRASIPEMQQRAGGGPATPGTAPSMQGFGATPQGPETPQGPVDPYAEFKAAWGREYPNEPLTQDILNSNELLAGKNGKNISNQLFRLLPLDRQMAFPSDRLKQLDQADIVRLVEHNPNVAAGFPTDFWKTFSNDWVQKVVLPFFAQNNPAEADNIAAQNGGAAALPTTPGATPATPGTPGTPSGPATPQGAVSRDPNMLIPRMGDITIPSTGTASERYAAILNQRNRATPQQPAGGYGGIQNYGGERPSRMRLSGITSPVTVGEGEGDVDPETPGVPTGPATGGGGGTGWSSANPWVQPDPSRPSSFKVVDEVAARQWESQNPGGRNYVPPREPQGAQTPGAVTIFNTPLGQAGAQADIDKAYAQITYWQQQAAAATAKGDIQAEQQALAMMKQEQSNAQNARNAAENSRQFDINQFGFSSGAAGGTPTMAREQQVAGQELSNFVAQANAAYQAAQVALSQGNLELAQQHTARADALAERAQGLQESQFKFNVERSPSSAASRTFALRGQQAPATPQQAAGGYGGIQNYGGGQSAPGGMQRTQMQPPRPGDWGSPEGGIQRIQPYGDTQYATPSGIDRTQMLPTTAGDYGQQGGVTYNNGAVDKRVLSGAVGGYGDAKGGLDTTMNPLSYDEITQSPYTSPGVKAAFTGKNPGQASFQVPYSAQYDQLLPSEQEEFDATLGSAGIAPQDYHKQRTKLLSASPYTPRASSRVVQSKRRQSLI